MLVDTSVWIRHFHCSDPRFERLLRTARVLTHGFVIGELACGRLRDRGRILELLQLLARSTPARENETLRFIEDQRLWGRGLGWVDVHLLASARVTPCRLWTLDQALRAAASEMGVDYEPV